MSIPFALALGLALANCSERDEEPLWAVRNCKSHDQCAKANPLYDRCRWACGSDVTYCQVSCETDDDCKGRGLPSDWVFCDIPRPGQGYCNPYGYDYAAGDCRQDPPEIPET